MPSFEDRYYNSADGIRLHYRDYAGPSDLPPVICLPGLTRNARDFEPLAEAIAGEWRVLALDFRGRGLSAPDPDPSHYLPPYYAADVLKLLDQLGIADAVFVGTSLGGLVTMLIARSDEERIAGALINDVGPELDRTGIERIRGYVGQARQWSSWTEAGTALSESQGDVFPGWNAPEWERYARRLCREDDGSIVLDYDMAIAAPFAAANASDAPQPDLWPLLNGFRGKPVTILRGERTDLFAADVAERMVREIGDSAELVSIPGVGHAPTFDEPESIAAVRRLLDRVKAANA